MNLEKTLRANIRLLAGQHSPVGFSGTNSSPIDSTSDPVDWIKQARWIKNAPFSFDEMPYLEGIQRDTSHVINIVKPRQMGVTELLLNWLLFNLVKNPGTTGIYVTDRYEHAKIFSNKRLAEAIAQSEYLKAKVPKNKGNLKWQPFHNGSNLYILSAWNGFEEARSIPADFAAVDEMQSVNVLSLPVLTESMSRSKFKKIIKTGTGSDEGDPWWDEWHRGTQYTWNPDMMDRFGRRGDWAQIPNTIFVPDVSSYSITNNLATWINPLEIQYKQRTMTPRSFTNEVVGWWYRGLRRPLVAKEIQNLFDRNLGIVPEDAVDDRWPIFMGIDLGGGTAAYTVAWIWQLVKKAAPRFKVLNVVKIDDPSTEKQADKLATLIDKYKVNQVVSDAGGGIRQVEKLSERYKQRFYKCHYRYDANNPYEIISNETRVNVDRTWGIETIIDLIKRPEDHPNFPLGIPRIQVPYKDPEKIEWIIDHFTCIEAENAEANGRQYVKYTHGEETNDDALHAAVYSYVAWLVWKDNQSFYRAIF